jgi:tRNA dimethylallyltransferase
MKKIIVISGPTASGKTSMAIKLAQTLDGEIINADASQVYSENKIISAQPTFKEQAGIPHHLFGYVKGDEEYTVLRWIKDVSYYVNNINKTIILVGGSGFYLKHLMLGLSSIPDIDQEASKKYSNLLADIGNIAFYNLLKELDQEAAYKLHPSDGKRMLRAYLVAKTTGKSIYQWQRQGNKPYILDGEFKMIILQPPREVLYKNCNERFLNMLELGALEEVKYLLSQNYNLISGVMKSHGVPELSKYLQGEWSLPYATEKSQQMVRNYAKRQITWFKHQFSDISKVFITNPEDDFSYCLDICKNYLQLII